MKWTKRTIILVGSIIIVLIAGISSRVSPTGFPLWDKYLGDALYAVLFYLILSLIWKKGTPLTKTWLSILLMLAIETFQLTSIPLRLRLSPHSVLRLLSIVLGTTFGWWDIVAYIAGILGIYCFDWFVINQLS